MKNLKISAKLLLGFSILILLSMIIAGVGLYSMQQMDNADQLMYSDNINSINLISSIRNNVLLQRLYLRELVINKPDNENFIAAIDQINTLKSELEQLQAAYSNTIFVDDELAAFNEFNDIYLNKYKPLEDKVIQLSVDGNATGGSFYLNQGRPYADDMSALLDLCYEYNMTSVKGRVTSNSQLFASSTVMMVVVLALSILIAIFVSLYLTRLISLPIKQIVRAADDIADGRVDVDIPSFGRDELGELAEAFRRMVQSIKTQSDFFNYIASSDYSQHFSLRNEHDALGKSLIDMTDSLNRIIYEVNVMSNEVANGASQVSANSQSLAQGSAEQAAAIEQLSSSIFEISINTKDNAKMAQNASELYRKVRNKAQDGNAKMDEMAKAVHDIDESSKSISRIIKTINDIAFQTNILSLNAAVEAANAGQHGKGFAVVAGEVRQLAEKSAQAAKDTQQLVQDSLSKSDTGSRLTRETQQAFKEIVDSIVESSQLLNDIAKSSNEQALGIEQVNIGIEQVAQVVNTVSTSAERSAVAAEQMLQQANSMRSMVSRIRLSDEYQDRVAKMPHMKEQPKQVSTAKRPQILLDLDTKQQKY